MRNRRSSRLARLAIGCLGISLLGCESIHSPSSDAPPSEQLVKASEPSTAGMPGDAPPSVVIAQRAERATPASPWRPFKGKIKSFERIWSVSHSDEGACEGGLYAGAEIEISGNFTHLGNTQGIASAAWDWATPAGTYSPEGPATGPSASIVGSHVFCTEGRSATGDVVLARKNGDELHGHVKGGAGYAGRSNSLRSRSPAAPASSPTHAARSSCMRSSIS
jgi:hypothetical protein